MYMSVPIGSCGSYDPVITLKPLWGSLGTELSTWSTGSLCCIRATQHSRFASRPLRSYTFLSRAPSRRARCSVAWWAKGRLGSLPPDPCRPRPHLASARTLGSRTSMPETMCCYQPTAQCAEHTQHTKLPVTHNISCCCPFTL